MVWDLLQTFFFLEACRGMFQIPGTQTTFAFEGQPLQNKAFSNQNKGHLGSRYI